MPLSASQQFVEGDDLGFIEIAAVQLEGLVLCTVNASLSAQLVQIPHDEERPWADELRVLARPRA